MIAHFPEPKAYGGLLTQAQKDLTWSRLGELIEGTQFKVAEMKSDGMCEMATNQHSDFPGRGSIISISKQNIDKANKAFADRNHMLHQYWMFYIAYTLLHELGHAMTFLALPIGYQGKCFLGHGLTSEIGFEIQSRVFGGIFDQETGSASSPDPLKHLEFRLVQRDWPNPHTLDLYRLDPDLEEILLRVPEPQRTIPSWKVNFSYINQMFQDTYWATPTNTLQFYRRTGVLVTALTLEPVGDGWGARLQRVDPDDPNAPGYVPRGFVYERSGLIRRAHTDG